MVAPSLLALLSQAQEGLEHLGELHGEHPLGGGALPQVLQRLEILEAHGPGIDT